MKKIMLLIIMIYILSFFIPIDSTNAESVSGNNSIYTFYVQNCTASHTNLSCDPASIKFECNITPTSLIDTVQFQIENTFYSAIQNLSDTSYWYYVYNKPQDFSDTTDPVSLERQKIYDVGAGYVIAYEMIDIPRTCDVCEATLTSNCNSCNTSDQQVCEYISSNETCQSSYNATETCNYCTPNWQRRSGGIYECQEDNTQFIFYDDFTGCHAMTGLLSDAPPFDHNTTGSCSYFSGDFNCTVDPQPYFDKKMNIFCELPSGTQTFSCNTYVKKDLNTSVLLQINPEFKETPQSIFGIFQKENEPRTSFINDGKNLNAYFTQKNLEVDNNFILGVKCSSNQTLLTWEQQITPKYKAPTWIVNRTVWIKQNAAYLVLGFILLFFTIAVITYLISQWKLWVRS